MTSMLARIELDDIVPGTVLPIDRYLVDPQALWKLSLGGTLYLAASGRGRAVYLVAVLEEPERSRIKKGDQRPDGWYAATNVVPVTDITKLRLGKRTGPLTAAQEAKLRAVFDDEGDEPVLADASTAGGLVTKIEELLALWRTTRSSEVADVIDRATRLLPRYDRPLLIDERDKDGSHERWLAAWHDERAEAMPQLLRNLAIGTLQHRKARLELIAEAGPDPRVARYLASHIHEITSSNRHLWVRFLRESRDAGAWQMLAPMLPELTYASDFSGLDRMLAFTQRAAGTAKLTEPQRERLRAIESSLVEDPTEHALIDAIADHHDEDEPYLIYSDWLLERGHPRGEYIALARQKQQGRLSPALARRLAALESVPFLFGVLDEVAMQRHRPKPRGLDRELIAIWNTTNATWREVSHAPLARALETLALVGNDREERLPGLVAVARAAPRLRRIEGFSQRPLQRQVAQALGWRTDGDAIVR
jgi:uncharacterized protein (TIGR02996 family)